jgi:dTDP-4-dehydrorhamnose reductase
VSPANVYGRSKAEAETRVLGAMPEALVVRTSAFFGPWDRYNFAWNVIERLAAGERVTACDRTIVSPTYVPDLCQATLDLLVDGEAGLWHLANPGQVSWFEFARRVAEGAGFDPALVQPATPAGKPGLTALASRRGTMLRPFEQALEEYLSQVRDNAELSPLAIAAE